MAQTTQTCAEATRPALRRWRTGAVKPSEAFDYYREAICSAFMPLQPELPSARRRGFSAEVNSYQFGNRTLNIVSGSSHHVRRGRAEIGLSPFECHYFNFQIEGTCRITQRGRSIVLRAGDFGVFDGATPFTVEHDENPVVKVASLMVAKDTLHEINGRGLNGDPQVLSLHPAYGALAAEAGRTLAMSAHEMTPDAFGRLSDIVLSLSALGSQEGQSGPAQHIRSQIQFRRVTETVRRDCRNPGFDLAGCAERVSLSKSYIHQLFAMRGERFGVFLLNTRLALAAQALADHACASLPVATIAFDCGFKDLSHFGRAFRDRYGVPPGEWRGQGARKLPRS